jgi:hypothetical protein
MSFAEIEPLKTKGTGVRCSRGRYGLTFSLSGPALEALGDPGSGAKVRVYIDRDAAAPRAKISLDPDGRFCLFTAPRGGTGTKAARGCEAKAPASTMILRIGQRAEFKGDDFRGLDCAWERCNDDGDRKAIIIDLPREMRQTESVPIPGRTDKSITLPKVGTRP